MNRSEYTRALIQYVVGYMCKNEKSPIDAVNMLKHIVNSTISDSTSFSSIAHRFNHKLFSSLHQKQMFYSQDYLHMSLLLLFKMRVLMLVQELSLLQKKMMTISINRVSDRTHGISL